MRISLNENSPHYTPDAYLYQVFCDGEKVQYCFEACEETGRAWVLMPGGPNGEEGGTGIQLKIVKGKITLVKLDTGP
jgi:hypothetical protein